MQHISSGKWQECSSEKIGIFTKKISTAAPFRKGKRTMVNTKIRDAWQIEAKYVLLESNFSKIIEIFKIISDE